jgi:2-keto-4-pentenoate hydratase/2-oxohepta-3-ene-1,7-dioic acid hydratase in catechol pathway
MHYSIGEAISFASKGEHLHPGELFGTGTLPGGGGMENGHWLSQDDTISLQIDRIGELTNMIKGHA